MLSLNVVGSFKPQIEHPKFANMTSGDPEIRDFKKSGDLLKWIHNNGVMNLSVVIIYSIVDSIINAFSSSIRSLDPRRRVSTMIESFWLNKESLMLQFFSKRVFL